MCGEKDLLLGTGLQFFGSVTASISHELKNALAVINENGGLLEDLVLRAEKGIPLDPGRLKTLSARITKQVKRAETIINNMNRFAHSADRWEAAVDLNETVALSAAVADRFVSMAECTLSLDFPGEPVMVHTSPFCLEALIWHCLRFAVDHAGETRALEVTVTRSEEGGGIRFTGLGDLDKAGRDAFPAERENALLSALDATFAIDCESRSLELAVARGNAPAD